MENSELESLAQPQPDEKQHMQTLFNLAMSTSNKDIYERHIRDLLALITEEHENNIMAAANRGAKSAVIAIYNCSNKYKAIMPIHEMLFPSGSLETKYKSLGVKNLTEQLKDKFTPFIITVVPVEQLISADVRHKNNPEWLTTTNAIIVEWPA
jgi:hypothetical protein